MQCTSKAELALAVAGLGFFTSREKRVLYDNLDNVKELALLSINGLAKIVGRTPKIERWDASGLEEKLARQRKIMEAYRISFCLAEDGEYPALLREIFDPPFMLFWRGSVECLHGRCASIVGTRRATGAGLKAAFDLAQTLAQEGVTVVSGLARGIDAAAHKGALAAASAGGAACAAGARGGASAEGERNIGRTAAVLACGVENIYPAMNRKLGAAILQGGGCILSEYPPEEPPYKWSFPARNRIISALSPLTAVVEAPPNSGALITADFALEQGRDVVVHELALKYPSGAAQGGGRAKRSVQSYVDDGAPLVKTPEQVLELALSGFAKGGGAPQQGAGGF